MNTPTQHTTNYKNSALGLIPEDWEVKHFKDVSDIDEESLKGNTAINYEFDYVSLSDVNSDEFKIETTKQVFGTAPSRARRIVKKGDVLMSTVRPNLQGFTFIKDDVNNLIASTGFAVITATKCNNEFLFHYLFSDLINKQFFQLLVGSNYPAINSSDVKSLKLPIPSLPEQTAIANCLSTWDKAIAAQTQLIAQKELRKKALMQQLLSGKKRLKGFSGEWKEVKLGKVAEIDKRTLGSTTSPEYSFQYLSLSDINVGVAEIKAEKLAFKDSPSRARRVLIKGDVLLATVRPNLQGFYLIKENVKDLIASTGFSVISCTKISNEFLYHFLFTRNFMEQVESIITGSNYPAINSSDVKNLKIPYPAIEEQTAIANILQCADEEIQILKKKLQQLKDQKKGLMQVLLTGKQRLVF